MTMSYYHSACVCVCVRQHQGLLRKYLIKSGEFKLKVQRPRLTVFVWLPPLGVSVPFPYEAVRQRQRKHMTMFSDTVNRQRLAAAREYDEGSLWGWPKILRWEPYSIRQRRQTSGCFVTIANWKESNSRWPANIFTSCGFNLVEIDSDHFNVADRWTEQVRVNR